MKDRVRPIATALRAGLPDARAEAAQILVDATPPPLPTTENVASTFGWWPLLQVFEDHGADAPATTLTCAWSGR